MSNKKVFSKVGRFIVIVLGMLITFSYAMFQGGFVSWFLFYTLIPFLLFSFFLTFVPIQIEEVRREIHPTKLTRGDTATVTIHFKNKTWFPLAFVLVRELGLHDNISEKAKGGTNLFFVGLKRNFHWSYEISDLPRGEIQFSTLQFTFTDFFGWAVRQKFVVNKEQVIVYPKLIEMNYKPIQMQFNQGGALSPYAFIKDTSMVTGVRNYQVGDRFSWIHWKSFAKSETLKTKDFENRQNQEIAIVLDATSQKHLEEVIELSASVLQAIVKFQGDVSFFIAREKVKFYPQIKTYTQLEEIMSELAKLEVSDSKKLDFLLSKERKAFESSSMMIFTGELTESLKSFFMNHSKGIICFVVTTQHEIKQFQMERNYFNVKIIPITKEMFTDVFTEVLKP